MMIPLMEWLSCPNPERRPFQFGLSPPPPCRPPCPSTRPQEPEHRGLNVTDNDSKFNQSLTIENNPLQTSIMLERHILERPFVCTGCLVMMTLKLKTT